jgi:hypothetical protein
MPITQERMIDLLAESESAFDAMESLVKDIRTTLDSRNLSDAQKIAVIGATCAMPLPQPLYTIVERRHFKRFAKYNDRMKDKAYNRRHARELDREADRAASMNPPKHPAWQSPTPNAPEMVKSEDMAQPAFSASEMAAKREATRLAALRTTEADVIQHQRDMYLMTISEFPIGEQERMLARWDAQRPQAPLDDNAE